MRVLVTGGCGFVGSHVVWRLVAQGHAVTVVDNLSGQGARERQMPEGITFHDHDVRDTPWWCRAQDVVIHLAAQVDVPSSQRDPLFDVSVNVNGTVNVLDASARYGVSRVVLASSSAIYGEQIHSRLTEGAPLHPGSPYAAAKCAAEAYLFTYARTHGFSACALRFANVYGPGQVATGEGAVVAQFVKRRTHSEPLVVFGDGTAVRDFVYVGDVADCICRATTTEHSGVFNVGTGVGTSIAQLAAWFNAPVAYAEARPGDVARCVLDPTLAETRLGWRARTDLTAGLTQTWNTR